jgi:Outer membrane protein beta-barrel domain
LTRSGLRLPFVVGATLAIAACLSAGTARADWALGVESGVAAATFLQYGSHNFADYDSRPAARFALGAVFEHGYGRWRLRVEPLYSQKGARFMDPGCPCLRPPGYVPQNNDLRTQYAELPVLAAVSSGRAGRRSYAVFGPVVSYLIAARQTRDGQETDEKAALRHWDVGLTAGGGLEGSGEHAWFLEARWTFGLLSVNDESLLNQVGQLLVGVTFRRSR